MKRYIEAEALIKVLETSNTKIDGSDLSNGYNEAMIAILRALIAIPTADVEEVRRGVWILHKDGSGTCSECLFTQKSVWDFDNWQSFCGHCGAKMDGWKKK